jgi:hypothetical protein
VGVDALRKRTRQYRAHLTSPRAASGFVAAAPPAVAENIQISGACLASWPVAADAPDAGVALGQSGGSR